MMAPHLPRRTDIPDLTGDCPHPDPNELTNMNPGLIAGEISLSGAAILTDARGILGTGMALNTRHPIVGAMHDSLYP